MILVQNVKMQFIFITVSVSVKVVLHQKRISLRRCRVANGLNKKILVGEIRCRDEDFTEKSFLCIGWEQREESLLFSFGTADNPSQVIRR